MIGKNRESEKMSIPLDLNVLVDLVKMTRRAIEPPQQGIYLLFDGNEIVYVGRSVHVRQRVESHRDSKQFDSYAMVPVPEIEQTWVEKALIQALQPKYNRALLQPGGAW